MLQYLKHEDIDFQRWDDCINHAINSYVYGYSWYLNIVAGEWDALVEEKNEMYQRVFPLPYRKKAGIKYIYQPPFTQQLGLFSRLLKGNEKLQEFLDAIPADFRLVELNLNKYHVPEKRQGVEIRKNRNMELEIKGEYEDVYVNYSQNLKRNLKKAEKNALQLLPPVKPEELIGIFKRNNKNATVYSGADYQRLQRLMYAMIAMGKASIVSVGSGQNNLLAAAFFMQSKGRSIFLFSGLTAEGREMGAMPFLIDRHIRYLASEKTILDFEGSNDDMLMRFYKGFGAAEFSYYSFRRVRMNPFLRFGFKLYKKLR